jgi:RecG-like helicase
VCESTNGKVENVKDMLQYIPIDFSKRTIGMMRDNAKEDLFVTYESEIIDSESATYHRYGVNTAVVVKVRVHGAFVGFLNIGFRKEYRLLNQEEDAMLRMYAGKVGVVMGRIANGKSCDYA